MKKILVSFLALLVIIGCLSGWFYYGRVNNTVSLGKNCGITNDNQDNSSVLSCMNEALYNCSQAFMYDVKNPIAQESYEILGAERNACQVRHTQHTKPPQTILVCKYSTDSITKTKDFFSAVVLKSGFSCN